MKAIRRKPDFDIALANLGNAVKDLVRPRALFPHILLALIAV